LVGSLLISGGNLVTINPSFKAAGKAMIKTGEKINENAEKINSLVKSTTEVYNGMK